MTQSTHPQPHDLTALAYALVPSPEREALLEHLAQCDACREAYDVAFEEQADVRSVLLEESRSGEAEARALDRVLQSLKALSEPVREPAGKLYSLPRPAFYALEIAAALLVCAGIFYVAVVIPGGESVPSEVASTGTGEGALTDPGVTIPEGKPPTARIDSGSAMVAVDVEQNNWTPAREIPLNTWTRNDGQAPVVLSYDNTSLNFETGSCFMLQADPVNKDQIAVFVLRGEANMTANNQRSLRILTNNADFVAAPGASFEIECNAVFNFRNFSRRGKDVPSTTSQALTRASVENGDVMLVPVGEVWEAPQLGLLERGQQVELRAVERQLVRDGATKNVRLIKAIGASLGHDKSAGIENYLGKLDPDSRRQLKTLSDELKVLRAKLEETNRGYCQRIVINNRVFEQEGDQVRLSDSVRAITLTIDLKNDLVAKVTVNGESRDYRFAALDELAKERPDLADMLAAVKIERLENEKRQVVLKDVIAQHLESENQQEQKQVAPQQSK